MHQKTQIIKYLAVDILSALTGWLFFYMYYTGQSIFTVFFNFTETDTVLLTGLAVLPGFWIFLNFGWGFYRNVFRRSRLKEMGASISVALTGTLLIFMFMISRPDMTFVGGGFFGNFMALFSINLVVFYVPRLIITTHGIKSIRKGKTGFNTIIIGSDQKAVDIYREITTQIRSTGNIFIGFISIHGSSQYQMSGYLEHLGGADDLPGIISKHEIDEVILAIESTEHGKIEKIINELDQPGLVIKAIPALHDILTGRVRINTVIETPLIGISRRLMPVWQKNLKTALDIILSLLALIVLLPFSIIIMLWIRLSTEGPVIYSHERIGRNGKPFKMYKFRTMINDAEKNGPELSSENDHRVTVPGRFLRRTRLDEIPNFINVIKGDMSLVGPRPERKYYIDQIIEKAPHYKHLLKIKPGITSWGQIKYGYAENVEQMIQRLKYDIIYLDNMSVFVDFQILILTVAVLFKRDGV
jgi:exopolysaccharide biosynthesis polyprenyl glycosylphosphotransferase